MTSVLAAGAFAAAAAAYLATPYPIAAAIGAGLGALSLVFLGAAFADLRGARRLAAIAQASPGDAEPAAPGLRPGAA